MLHLDHAYENSIEYLDPVILICNLEYSMIILWHQQVCEVIIEIK